MSQPPLTSPDTHPDEGGEEGVHLRRERRQILLLALGMVVFGTACWYSYPHITPLVKNWLAHRHLPETRRQIQQKNWMEAATSLRDARRWAADDPEVLRVTLEFLNAAAAEDTRATLNILLRLQAAGAATPEDLTLMGMTHLRQGEVARARQIYSQLPPETRQQRQGLELQAELLHAAGDTAKAEAVRRQALLCDPDDPESLRQLAEMDLQSLEPSRREAMSARLWQVARAGNAAAPVAIEILAASTALTVPQLEELSGLVEALAGPASEREPTRFKVQSARLRLQPHLRNEFIDQEIRRWKNRTPTQTAPLVLWLAAEREYDRILRLVPAQTAARHTDLLPPYVDALRARKKWQELNTLLTTGGIDAAYSKLRIRLWQVETQAHLRPDNDRIRQLLLGIFEDAGRGDDPVITLDVASLSEQLNQWDLAEKCYATVITKHPRASPALLPRLYQMAAYQHDGPGMLSASARLLACKPDNPMILAQTLYLQLLLGIELELAGEQLRSVSRDTAAPSDRLCLLQALAAFRAGQLQAVNDPISRVAKPEALTAGERAVFAGLLKLSGGDNGQAFRLVERISPGLLLPEEKRFMKRAL
ncbi:tetratricopeptide repeat protein [Prosthecobacter sp.]|uniref:tetratricopeptide repeat protein n=1 Tax=Prosthecobacter sp. TaxID=1965333 RepID=UPI0037837E5C